MQRKRINLTLPDDVYDVLIADAERNCRSISEEVTYMVRTHKGKYSTISENIDIIKPKRKEIL